MLFGSGAPLCVANKLCMAKDPDLSANPLENAMKLHSLVLNSSNWPAGKLLQRANSTQMRSTHSYPKTTIALKHDRLTSHHYAECHVKGLKEGGYNCGDALPV